MPVFQCMYGMVQLVVARKRACPCLVKQTSFALSACLPFFKIFPSLGNFAACSITSLGHHD